MDMLELGSQSVVVTAVLCADPEDCADAVPPLHWHVGIRDMRGYLDLIGLPPRVGLSAFASGGHTTPACLVVICARRPPNARSAGSCSIYRRHALDAPTNQLRRVAGEAMPDVHEQREELERCRHK
eukprot:6743837-Prymnesium_polylepis.1